VRPEAKLVKEVLMEYAGIGSRSLTRDEWNLCFKIGAWLAERGWSLRTGAADGADKAFVEGAMLRGGKVTLCIPWPSYNYKWVEPMQGKGATVQLLTPNHEDAHRSVYVYHPNPYVLSDTARMLHARNYLIVKDCTFVLAHPHKDRYGSWGGTGQGMRVAAGMGIEVLNLFFPADRKRITDKIYQ
jgi:hypothetical protein